MNLLTLAKEAGSEGFQEIIHKLKYPDMYFRSRT